MIITDFQCLIGVIVLTILGFFNGFSWFVNFKLWKGYTMLAIVIIWILAILGMMLGGYSFT